MQPVESSTNQKVTLLQSKAGRAASDIFTSATFKKIIQDNDSNYFSIRAKRVCEYLSEEVKWVSNLDYLKGAYQVLIDNYKNEYYFKNSIIKQLIDTYKNKEEFTIFSEFKINKSIADLVLVNGIDKVFEIKTELDKPDRLKNQVYDYRKVFSEVVIVVSYTQVDKYLPLAKELNIGLTILNEYHELQEIQTGEKTKKYFDLETIIKCLRKNECSSIYEEITGYQPNVSNIEYLDECFRVYRQVELETIQKMVLDKLKQRNMPGVRLLTDKKTIEQELLNLCISLNFSDLDYHRLSNFLYLPFTAP